MRKLFFIILFFGFSIPIFSQGKFERKIIIDDSLFYAVEIIDQVGVLWVGNINEPLDSAELFALPAGTKRRSIHFIPFAWDIKNDTLFAVNFTEYAQNERLSSFKSIPLHSLEKYTGNKSKQLMQGAFENSKIENWPMVNMLKKYKYIDDLFFDIVVKDSTIYQFISVNNELTVWKWENNNWNQSKIFEFETPGYFTALLWGENIYLVNWRGEKFFYNGDLIINASRIFDLQSTILIDNRNESSHKFIKSQGFENTAMPLNLIIEKYSVIN
ncbi:MAG: hypothetical protein ACHQFW_10450 [Chitinophagales bacterium]